MPSWTFSTPPTWAPNSVATDKGWVDGKTGEVLVAVKNLKNATEYSNLFEKGGKPLKRGRGGARPGAGRPPKVDKIKLIDKWFISPVIKSDNHIDKAIPKVNAKVKAKAKATKRKAKATKK